MWVEANRVTLPSCLRIEGKIDTTIYCPVSFLLDFVRLLYTIYVKGVCARV